MFVLQSFDKHQYAKRVVNQFCEPALNKKNPTQVQLELTEGILYKLHLFRFHFQQKSLELKWLSKAVNAEVNYKNDRETFEHVAALNTIVLIFTNSNKQNQRPMFQKAILEMIDLLEANKMDLERDLKQNLESSYSNSL